jgi:hypothetical protein
MRPLPILVALMLFGCSSSNLSSNNGDGSTDANNMSMMDLTVEPDLGGPGASCMTACDCLAGLACNQMNQCEAVAQGMVYCCERSCPTGSFCQSMDGTFMMCGGGRDGGFMRPDGGRPRDGGFGRPDGGRNRDM